MLRARVFFAAPIFAAPFLAAGRSAVQRPVVQACAALLLLVSACDDSGGDGAACTGECPQAPSAQGGSAGEPASNPEGGAGGEQSSAAGGSAGAAVTMAPNSPASGGEGPSPSPETGGGGGTAGTGGALPSGQGGTGVGGAETEPSNGAAGAAGSGDAGASTEPEPDVPGLDAGASSSRLTAVPVGSTEATLGYWEYLPPGYSDGPVPLLVFTHGAAWQGDGSEAALQDLLEVGPPNLINSDLWPNDRPFVVLSPQNPRSGCFDPNDIDDFYHYAVDSYDIDPNRIYHTGQSCGAVGAWGYLAAHLDEFVTAAVLIAGDGQDAFDQAGCELGRIAIWGFHNENDMTVPSTGTIEPINALLACSPVPDVQATIYPGESAHDAWTKTYDLSAGHDIYTWLLEHTHP